MGRVGGESSVHRLQDKAKWNRYSLSLGFSLGWSMGAFYCLPQVLLVFDLSDAASFQRLDQWIAEAEKHNKGNSMAFVVAANKVRTLYLGCNQVVRCCVPIVSRTQLNARLRALVPSAGGSSWRRTTCRCATMG